MAAARSRRPSLAKMCPMWLFTVPSLMTSVRGDLGVGSAAADQREHVALVLGQLFERFLHHRPRNTDLAVARDHTIGDPRIEPTATSGDLPHRRKQVLASRVLEDETGGART